MDLISNRPSYYRSRWHALNSWAIFLKYVCSAKSLVGSRESFDMIVMGALAGLLGVGAAVFAIVYALGIGEYMGGKKPRASVPVNKDELKQIILGINAPGLPYEIKAAADADLLVEWKIVDARWFAVFAKERLRKTYRAFLVLDPQLTSVRYCEELASVRWVAGNDGVSRPFLSYQSQFFRGRILFQKSWGVQYGVRDDLTVGKIYEYSFDVRMVRDHIKKLVEASGWEFIPVIRRSHTSYQSITNRPN